ncbi:MAG: hypothetical protein AB1571_02520 [Nanoarchaeota archaeon]
MKQLKYLTMVVFLVAETFGCGGNKGSSISHKEAISKSDGILSFTLDSKEESVNIKLLSLASNQPIEGVNGFLITNNRDVVFFLIDPSGRHFPRIIKAEETLDQLTQKLEPNEVKQINPKIVGIIKEIYLVAVGRLAGDEPAAITSDNVPDDLLRYITQTFFEFWRKTQLKDLDFNLKDFVIEQGIDIGIDLTIKAIFDVSLGPISLAITAVEISQTAIYAGWAKYYRNQCYSDSDLMDIYKPNILISSIIPSSFLLTIVVPEGSPKGTPTNITIGGLVVDATTDDAISGAFVTHIETGYYSLSNFRGEYTLSIKTCKNTYSLSATLAGYEPEFKYDIPISSATNIKFALSPYIPFTGRYRVVLTWGEYPLDLDSHLWTPLIDGSTYEIYFASPGSSTSPPYADLDVDDVTSYGPETITIYTQYTGTYTYAVYNYSGSPEITTSNAVVKLYDNLGLLEQWSIPAGETGRWWNVFTLNGNIITTINTISNTQPLP